jgi:DNA topoisomerase-2
MAAFIEKKKKINVNQNIKEQLILFLRCDIENPAFNSQTKDYMNTPSSGFVHLFGERFFYRKLSKMGGGCVFADGVEGLQQDRQEDGRAKTKSVRGIANFIDANNAGTARSSECMLILCEVECYVGRCLGLVGC